MRLSRRSLAPLVFLATLPSCTTDDITNVYVLSDASTSAPVGTGTTPPANDAGSVSAADASRTPEGDSAVCNDDVGPYGACEQILLNKATTNGCLDLTVCATLASVFRRVEAASIANCIAAQTDCSAMNICALPALSLACPDDTAAIVCAQARVQCEQMDAGLSDMALAECMTVTPGMTPGGRDKLKACYAPAHCDIDKAIDCLLTF